MPRAALGGHAVARLARDEGRAGGALHLRHPPHPLRHPVVHLPRRGLRPRPVTSCLQGHAHPGMPDPTVRDADCREDSGGGGRPGHLAALGLPVWWAGGGAQGWCPRPPRCLKLLSDEIVVGLRMECSPSPHKP